jgi:hypothetical protein
MSPFAKLEIFQHAKSLKRKDAPIKNKDSAIDLQKPEKFMLEAESEGQKTWFSILNKPDKIQLPATRIPQLVTRNPHAPLTATRLYPILSR